MILLNNANLLFLKAKKVAGTSIEIALSHHAGPGDIITPLAAKDEILRRKLSGQSSQNWAKNDNSEKTHDELIEKIAATKPFLFFSRTKKISNYRKLLRKTVRESQKFYNHITPQEIIDEIGIERVNGLFKVAVVRDPYDQLLSLVYYILRNEANPSKDLLTKTIDDVVRNGETNNDYYFLDGQKICDFYIKYEQLNDDLSALQEKIGLPLLDRLPKSKHGFRNNRRSPESILSRTQKEIWYGRNRMQFEHFKYNSLL